jgi:hypothetical protein
MARRFFGVSNASLESNVASVREPEHIPTGSNDRTIMVAKLTKDGLLIPRSLLRGITRVEIRRRRNRITLLPSSKPDPIHKLGRKPVLAGRADGSANHDAYVYGRTP